MESRIREKKISAARSVAADYNRRDDTLASYLGGSLFAGLGNSTSDVDLFVVTANGPDDTIQHITDGERVDVEVKSARQLISLLHSTIEPLSRSNPGMIHEISITSLDDVVRFLLSEPVFDGGLYAQYHALLKQNEGYLRQRLILKWASAFSATLEDTLGWLEDDAHEELAVATQDLLLKGAQAFLAGCADYYTGLKWVFTKLRRRGNSFPYHQWVELWSAWPELHDRAGWHQLAVDRIRFGQALIAAACIYGWDEPEAERWSYWGLHGDGVRRDVVWTPTRYCEGGQLAKGIGRPLDLSWQGLLLWGACDGRQASEIIADVASVLGDGTTVDAVTDYLHNLASYKTVVLIGDRA